MTTHRLINISIALAGALALAALLSTSYMLDGQDHHAEWAESTSLKLAQDAAALDARMQKAAQALCSAEKGPQSEARWTEDGELVCTARRGAQSLQVAGGLL
jgi:hypothetical protein